MASRTVSLSDATATPERLPGIRIMGFQCCHCSEVTLTNSLGKCYDDRCSHEYCHGCTVIDRAGRLWDKTLAVSLHWLCRCGFSHPVADKLGLDDTGKLAKPLYSCQAPSFVVMYNKYGRLCKNMRLSVMLPFALDAAEDVETLFTELKRTP